MSNNGQGLRFKRGLDAVNAGTRGAVWYCAVAAVLVGTQIAVLHAFGQPFVSATGRILLWVNDPFSLENSQQLADWYSFSHLIHGFIFYGLFRWAAPRLPFAGRLLMAICVEIAWELTENTPMVIQHYRQQALAEGYTGDSILNSVSDTLMMCVGFFVAARLRCYYVVALALMLEVFTACTVRDNLTLNVINLITPAEWAPVQAIHTWQARAKYR
jgi:hypothetical protein